MDRCVPRSIFFFNSEAAVGQTIQLHLFEPRYRLMIKRAMEDASRMRQVVFLPNFRDYTGSHGDVGFLCVVTRCQLVPGRAGELPRANVTMTLVARMLVLFHWIEPSSAGLHECLVAPLAGGAPHPSHLQNLRRWLASATDGKYVADRAVSVYPEPDVSSGAVGRLNAGDEIDALEVRTGARGEWWLRHARGWSKASASPGSAPAGSGHRMSARRSHGARLAREHGIEWVEGSGSSAAHVLLLHHADPRAAAAACAAVEAALPGASDALVPVLLPPTEALCPLAVLLERLAAVFCEGEGPKPGDGAEQQAPGEVAAFVRGLGADLDGTGLASALEGLSVRASTAEERGRAAAHAFAEGALRGLHVPVACGAPCGMVVRRAELASALEGRDQYDALEEYCASQWAWEASALRLCPPPGALSCAGTGVAELVWPGDACACAQLSARYCMLHASDAQSCVQRASLHVHWCRVRLLFIGHAEAECPLSRLDVELVRCVATFVLRHGDEATWL